MSRVRVVFVCQECGADTPRWQGQCPSCEAWNTLVEERIGSPRERRGRVAESSVDQVPVVRLAELEPDDLGRWSTGIDEFDFALGGGIVPGSIVLIGGEPGIGKSTLILQAAARLVGSGRRVLYVAGEESPAQIRMRSDRLDPPADEVQVLAETDLNILLARCDQLKPDVLLVDSIQTIYAPDLDAAPGSIGQVRECAARLQRFSKDIGAAVFLVGHVTKGGGIAGPKTLEHIVDTVLYFEAAGGADHRILRATKNRFGSVDEIGVFRMTAGGLIPVQNPSELFLGDRQAPRSGCSAAGVIEGTRPLMLEVQALATRSPYGAPQRVSSGFDHKRLALLLAVLEKHAGLSFSSLDIFLNVVGGLRIVETAADAAVVVALASSLRDLPARSNTIVVGEVGLGGELRPVGRLDRRLAEAARLGFTTAVVPLKPAATAADVPIRIETAPDIRALLGAVFD